MTPVTRSRSPAMYGQSIDQTARCQIENAKLKIEKSEVQRQERLSIFQFSILNFQFRFSQCRFEDRLPSEHGRVAQLFFDAQELVVLGHAVAAGGRSGLDLARVRGHG